MTQKEDLKKYFFIGTIIILLFLAYKIISPYLITLITAFILAYLIKPLFTRMSKRVNKSLSAATCTFLILLIIILPFGFLIGGVVNQIDWIFEDGTLGQVAATLSESPIIERFSIDLAEVSGRILEYLASMVASIITSIPSLMISALILILGIYYILMGWDDLSKKLEKYLPLKNKRKTAKEISETTKAIIYGSLLVAIIQLFVALPGFYFSGVGAWMVCSILIFFLAFFPGIGPAILWVPLAIYYFITKDFGTLTGVIITGVLLSYLVDTILRAKILGKTTGVNPFIMLLGIIGGITVFGIFGFIIGPLVLIYAIKIVKQAIKNN